MKIYILPYNSSNFFVFHILGAVSLKVKVPILFLLQLVIYLYLHYILLIIVD